MGNVVVRKQRPLTFVVKLISPSARFVRKDNSQLNRSLRGRKTAAILCYSVEARGITLFSCDFGWCARSLAGLDVVPQAQNRWNWIE